MSILEKYDKIFLAKDEAGMNEILHDDFKFTMHSSGNQLSKSDVIGWAMSDDISEDRDRSRIIYENDELDVCMFWEKKVEGMELAAGIYLVEIYIDDYLAGKTKIELL